MPCSADAARPNGHPLTTVVAPTVAPRPHAIQATSVTDASSKVYKSLVDTSNAAAKSISDTSSAAAKAISDAMPKK